LSAAKNVASKLTDSQLLSGSQLPAANTSYRVQGDQVSLVGTQIGTIETLPNTSSLGWLSFLDNHSMDTVLQLIGETPIPGVPDNKLSPFITAVGSVLAGGLLTDNFVDINVLQGALSAFDPSGGSKYRMTETSTSPLFASLALPFVPGVSSYRVSIESGTTWSAPQIMLPGVRLTPPSPFDGFQFIPLNGSGQVVNTNASIVFDTTFASAGAFSGTLSVSGSLQVPNDFNGDGISDVLWSNLTNDRIVDWSIANGEKTGSHVVNTARAGDIIVGTGDFNGDRTTDLLLQNSATGAVLD
jgi:hypothetical protein